MPKADLRAEKQPTKGGDKDYLLDDFVFSGKSISQLTATLLTRIMLLKRSPMEDVGVNCHNSFIDAFESAVS